MASCASASSYASLSTVERGNSWQYRGTKNHRKPSRNVKTRDFLSVFFFLSVGLVCVIVMPICEMPVGDSGRCRAKVGLKQTQRWALQASLVQAQGARWGEWLVKHTRVSAGDALLYHRGPPRGDSGAPLGRGTISRRWAGGSKQQLVTNIDTALWWSASRRRKFFFFFSVNHHENQCLTKTRMKQACITMLREFTNTRTSLLSTE